MTKFSRLLHLPVVSLGVSLLSCGARSELWFEPNTTTELFAYCPAALVAAPGEVVVLHAATAASLVRGSWTGWEASDAVRITATSETDAQFRADREGDWWLTYRAEFAPPASRQCSTAVLVRAAQSVVCPAEVSCVPGGAISVTGALRSAQPDWETRWSIETSPPGARAALNRTGPRSAALECDVEGDWLLAFGAGSERGPTERCATRVRSRRALSVVCPDATTVSVFDRVSLAPASVRNETGALEEFRWEVVERPRFSNAQLIPADSRETGLVPDMAGEWLLRLTVSAGPSTATCTTRVDALYRSALRVELHTNPRRDCPYCNSLGGGQQITFQLTDDTANGGRYPGDFRCQSDFCACTPPPEPRCLQPLADWPPAGPVNDPRKVQPPFCTVAGLESTAVEQTYSGARFGMGVMYQAACGDAITNGPEWPASVFVRVYCGGRLVYQSEVVEIADTTRRVANVWRIGTVTMTPDGGCVVQRRCAAGADQRGCIGDPQSVYDR